MKVTILSKEGTKFHYNNVKETDLLKLLNKMLESEKKSPNLAIQKKENILEVSLYTETDFHKELLFSV